MTTIPAPRGAEDARSRLLAGIAVTERRLELAGATTAVLAGGDGPPLVLLHGPAGNATHWLRVLPDLLADHRVVAPDLPGHGESEPCDDAVAWLGELIEGTCPAPPLLVGHALGGAIAARFAAAHPHRVGRLVLVDSLGLAPLAPAPVFGRALESFLAGPSVRTHDELWSHCAHDVAALRERMAERWAPFRAYNVDRARAPGRLPALGALMERYGAPEIRAADLAAIAVPTALIWGRGDLATPVGVAVAAAARHRWPLQVIEDCGDDPAVERPDAFVRALRATAPLEGALAAAGFGGELVGRAHSRYDELRAVYNGMVDRRPALIARCADARDVSVAVMFARERGLPVSVYGGGHNVTGNAVCEAGVTIDLRPMKRIEIDPAARTCRAAAGLTWGELDAATQEHGLAVTGGRVSTTGLGGLVLGGGSGWLERKCGYSVDNLVSIEVVTADGRVLTASATEHSELFWGTRGGGGNFGVVTRFDFRLHPIGPTILGGMLLYPAALAPAVLRNFGAALPAAPDGVGAGVNLFTLDGEPVCGVIACFAGPLAEGEEALRPLREVGPPLLDTIAPLPYVELQRLVDSAYPAGMRNYWTGDFLRGLPDEAIDVLCHFHGTAPSPLTQILTLPGGGAPARVPEGTMALGERGAPFNVHITSLWPDRGHDEANVAWTRALSRALKPFTTGRVYVNFIGDEGPDRVAASFGDAYPRLRELKTRFDPDNVFRSSQNIEPGKIVNLS